MKMGKSGRKLIKHRKTSDWKHRGAKTYFGQRIDVLSKMTIRHPGMVLSLAFMSIANVIEILAVYGFSYQHSNRGCLYKTGVTKNT